MKKYLLLFVMFLLIPFSVNADNDASITVTSSKTYVSKGDTITVNINITSTTPIGYYEYTLDYNTSKFKLINGSAYNIDRAINDSSKKITKTFKFKVIEDGSSKISVKSYAITNYENDSNLSVKVIPVTITSGNTSNYSSNNYLSNLEVEGYELSPKFNKKTTSYNLTLDNGISKIKIIAEPENSKSTITGDGEFEITSKDNKFLVTVKSEKGDKRTYTINTTISNDKKITIKIDDLEYTLAKDISSLDIPSGFKTKKITIDDVEITAFYNENNDYTLVGLKDKDNKINLYIYDENNNTYTLYKEIKINNISFVHIKTNEVLENYIKCKITINDIEMDCYKLSEDSNTYLIYGTNSNTNDEGWYSYNSLDKSFQKYNFDIDNFYENKIKNTQVLIYILSGTTLLFGIIIITLSAKKLNRKK